ncbi:MAG: hypothetical protein HOP08_01920 [Cyclobacteriaceae bacterium]|nr:hypothetical protein [Cyclobacteriaceae bacterium]
MKKIFTLLFIAFAVFSCSNDSDPAIDKSEFVRIYDNTRFNSSYFPIDVRQTSDGGYLILGGRRLSDVDPGDDLPGVYLMKVDEWGKFISDTELDKSMIGPIGPLLEQNGLFHFFCMKNFQTQLMVVDHSGTITNTLNIGGTYPCASAMDNGNFLLLGYDVANKKSLVSIITPNGNIQKSRGFVIEARDEVEKSIKNHFLRTGKQLPYQVGKSGDGKYFYNGFYNYTLSLVFTDLNSDTPMGTANGYLDNGGFSQLLPLEGNTFAAARFNFGDNYILPNVTINTSGLSGIDKLGGNSFPELVGDAPVRIIKTTISGKEVLVYASNTRSRQIALYFYDKTTGAFAGSHYLGFSNPFEVTNIVATADAGLAVCGTTYVAGRFPRICLFKLSKETLSGSIKK